jgi:hypothetical protein
MITSFNLFESEFHSLFEDKKWQDYREHHINFKSLDGVQMTDELGEQVFASDPTPNKNYRKWLIDILFKNTNYDEYIANLSDMPELLTIYNNGKSRIGDEYADWKNITKIKTFDQFKTVIQYIVDNGLHLSKQVKTGRKAIETDFKVLFENDEWKIIIPLTWAQSKKWASGAKWCTAADSEQGRDWFTKYSNGSPLYIFHNKINRNLNHQLWLGNCQYRSIAGDGGSSPEFRDFENSRNEPSFDKFVQKYGSNGFVQSILDFWNTNDPILKDSLGYFLKMYLTTPREDMSSISDMILQTNVSETIPPEYIEKVLITGLETSNINLVEKFFNEKPKYIKNINSNLSNGMTPLMTCIKGASESFGLKERDDKTISMCKYLVNLGADGTGTKADGTSNILMEALYAKKYRTAIFVLDLDNYDIEPSKDPEDRGVIVHLASAKVTSKKNTENLSFSEFDELMAKLTDRGLDINRAYVVKGRVSMTLLHIVLGMAVTTLQRGEKEEILENIEKIKILLKYGANPCLGIPPIPENKGALEPLFAMIQDIMKANGC